MQRLDKLWFVDMPAPVQWHPKWETPLPGNQLGILADFVQSRNKLTFVIDHELPPMNQEHDDTVDLSPIEADLRHYLDLIDGLYDVRLSFPSDTAPFHNLSWRHSCLVQHSSTDAFTAIDSVLEMERGMVVFALACVIALQAEQQMALPPADSDDVTPSHTIKETWRRAAGLFREAATRLPPTSSLHPYLHVWAHLCVVHAHSVEMQHVDDGDDTSGVQVARYHSALSRGGHSACVAAQTNIAQMHSTSTTCHQLRWLVLVYKALCKAAYCMNEVVLYVTKPEIALLFCDAVIKTKLPMPPQYPHRAFVLFTKLMQTLVATHQDTIARAMDMKATLQVKVSPTASAPLRQEHVQAFLAIEPLQLNTLQPILPPDHVDSTRLAVRAAFPDHAKSAPCNAMPSTAVVSLTSTKPSSHETTRRVSSTPSLLRPVQSPHRKGAASRIFLNPDTTTSRDIRVAMRAHNLGLLPDSDLSSAHRSTEWEYGVEPYTPRLDARQLTRGISLPMLPPETTTPPDEPRTASSDHFFADPTSAPTKQKHIFEEEDVPSNSHDDSQVSGLQRDPPMTLHELDCLVGAKTPKRLGLEITDDSPAEDPTSSSSHASAYMHPKSSPCESMTTPKVNRNMVTSKRKCCALCTRPFPVVNLVGVVLMKRILELRAAWGLPTVGTPKCAPASYLYRDVRVCVLCSDILYGLGHAQTDDSMPPSTVRDSPVKLKSSASTPSIDASSHGMRLLPPRPASSSSTKRTASIGKHVQQLRRMSLSAHTYATSATTTPSSFVEDLASTPRAPTPDSNQFVDEIGYMIHQRILNDALLLHAPSQVHHCVDLTQRRQGVVASQSSVLMLGVASNAINPAETHRGIHTREEQAPWWEVDLGSHCDISSVEVWNCADSDPQVAARLFPCHVLLLLKPGHRRPLVELLGVAVDSTMLAAPSQPLRWRPKAGSVCRYVRLVVDKLTYLHVERVHVFGTPLKDDLMVHAGAKHKLASNRPTTAAACSSKRPTTHQLSPLCKHAHSRGGIDPSSPSAANISTIPMRFQQDSHRTTGGPTSASPRPKSAGFLLPTASSHRRDHLTQVLREQLALEDQLNHPPMHQRHPPASPSTNPSPTTSSLCH